MMSIFTKKAVKVNVVNPTCETLMLDRFIKIICGLETLPDWWEELTAEYAKLRNDQTSNALFELQRSITTLELDLFLIQEIISRGFLYWDDRIGDMLRSLGYPFKYDNPDTREEELNETIELAKEKIIDKEELIYELQELKKEQKRKTLTEMDYVIEVQSLEKWKGIPMPLETTSVKTYIATKQLYKLMQPKDNGR